MSEEKSQTTTEVRGVGGWSGRPWPETYRLATHAGRAKADTQCYWGPTLQSNYYSSRNSKTIPTPPQVS